MIHHHAARRSRRVSLMFVGACLLLANVSLSHTAKAGVHIVDSALGGSVNGQPISGLISGELDVVALGDPPPGGGDITATFGSIPTGLHPGVITFITLLTGNALEAAPGALSLFELTGGDYDFQKQVLFPGQPGSFFQYSGFVRTDVGGQIMLFNSYDLDGVFPQAFFPTAFTDYQATLQRGPGETLVETGSGVFQGSSLDVAWTTTYSTGGALLPGEQTILIEFPSFNFDTNTNTLHVSWHGITRLVPEPSAIAVAGLLVIICASTGNRRHHRVERPY